jgi:hypothetical protein
MNLKEKKGKKSTKSSYLTVKTKVKAGVYLGLTLTAGMSESGK